MKNAATLFFLIAFLFSIQSCDKQPYACFKTDVDEDSIHVNQLVTFTAACSSNADDYYWEFDENADSAQFTAAVKKTFTDTGNVKVYLLVTNGRKQSSSSRSIHVHP